MALSPQEAAELRKQLQEIERLSRLLNKNIDTTSLQDIERQAGNIRAIFANLTDEFEDLTGEIGYATAGFKKLVQEITNSNIGVKETTKSFNKLSSIAERIQSYQKGYSDLTSKDIKKLKEQFDVEKQRLFNTQDILKDKKALLEAEKQNLAIQRNAAITAARAAQARNDRAGMSMAISQARSLENRIRKVNSEYDKTSSSINANNALLAEQDILLQGLEQSIGRTNDELKQQEKLLGLSGAVVGGLQKSLEKLGFGGLAQQLGIDEAQDKMKTLSRQIIEDKQKENNLQSDINKANTRNLSAAQIRAGFGGKVLKDQQKELDNLKASNAQYSGMSGKFKILQTGISSMGKSLLTNLKDPLSITILLVTQIVEAFTTLDDSIGKLAKNFGISYKEATNVSNSLNDAANASYLLNVTTQGLTEAFIELNNEYGTFAKINEEALVSFTRLTKEAGVTDEAAKSLFETTILTGKEVEASTSEFLGQAAAISATNGLALNQKQLLEGIQHISKATLLTLGGQPEALAKAVVNAKMLGVSLEQVEQISNSLLEFESSITAELEAELLLGKNINLEKARLAALNGDIATVAEEIAKQTGSAADFTKMNVIQQEALAKSVGMTREDLAKSLMEREALVKLSGVEGKTAQERFNNLVKEVGLEEAKRRLGDDNLANLYAGQNVQERFTAAIEKLKEIFISLAEPLMPVINAFAEIFKIVGPIAGVLGQMVKYTVQLGKYLLPVIAAYKTFQVVSGAILGIQALMNKEKAFEYITTKQNLTAKIGEKTYNTIDLIITKAKNLELLKGLGLKTRGLGLLAIERVQNMASAVANIVKGAWSALGPIPFVGAALAAAAVGTGIAYLLSQTSKAKSAGDVMSPANGKTQISTKEGGLFELSKNDDVIAAPGLLSGNSKGTPSASPMINIQPMIDRLVAVENVLVQILNKETNVYMDSTKVGTALNVGAVKIQ